MQDWSMMPEDVLDEISDCLDSRTDVVRFRSVCSSWRSAVPARRRLLPAWFPILPNDGVSDYTQGFCLSKRTVYLLTVPHYPHGRMDPLRRGSSWLIKVKEDVPNKMNLINPLSRVEFGPLPEGFPKVLDASRIRISELATEFVMQNMAYAPPTVNPIANALNVYMEKVVFMCLNCSDFAVLTIHISGKLALYKSGDKRWSMISDMSSPYDDVILFKDKFYAVDGRGRTVSVGLDSRLTEIAGPFHGGDKKFLVESCGELLLADMFLTLYADYEGPEDVEPNEFNSILTERTVKFNLYKLDSKQENWVELKDLGDKVLFLGQDCTFSASSSDLKSCKGNCIFFTGEFYYPNGDEDAIFHGCDIGVFDIATGRIGPLEDYISYSELFWPPPKWITSTALGVEDELDSLAL